MSVTGSAWLESSESQDPNKECFHPHHEKIKIYLPELALIVGTRAILGAGIAILLTDDMEKEQRRLLGWTLALIGAVTTVPLALELYAENRSHRKISPLEARDQEI